MYGLPAKQLSFLLRAGCDTLPMNLARWNIIVYISPVCSLCHSSQPTTVLLIIFVTGFWKTISNYTCN